MPLRPEQAPGPKAAASRRTPKGRPRRKPFGVRRLAAALLRRSLLRHDRPGDGRLRATPAGASSGDQSGGEPPHSKGSGRRRKPFGVRRLAAALLRRSLLRHDRRDDGDFGATPAGASSGAQSGGKPPHSKGSGRRGSPLECGGSPPLCSGGACSATIGREGGRFSMATPAGASSGRQSGGKPPHSKGSGRR